MANGLQTIINLAESIQFDRRNVVGIQYTRSEIPKVSETPTRNAWKMNVVMSAALPYDEYRDLIEQIDELDRRFPQVLTFSDNPNLSWIARYKGSMTALQQSAVTVQSFVGNQLTLTNLPSIPAFGSNGILFKQGDFIQIEGFPYPFTVVGPANSTGLGGDVLRGNANTVTLTTHRFNFITQSVVGRTLRYGNNVQFNMLCTNMPVYRLIPGATQLTNGVVTNNAYIEWSSDFQLYEWTGGV